MSSKAKYTYTIYYGLAGGPIHSRSLRAELVKAGFTSAPKDQGDIIIAHSAGCWQIPATSKPKLVVYIGMPLANEAPSKTWRKATKMALIKNPVMRTLKIYAKNTFYILTQPRRNLKIITSASSSSPVIFKNVPTIFIANQFDPWPISSKLDEFTFSKECIFINLPGSHDDLWDHPDNYVDIIKKYAELLAETKSR